MSYLTVKNASAYYGHIGKSACYPMEKINWGYHDYCVVERINKSGLMFVDYVLKSSLENSYLWCGLGDRGLDGSATSWSTIWTMKFIHNGIDSHVMSKIVTVSCALMQGLTLDSYMGTALFFVSAGLPLDMKFGSVFAGYRETDWNSTNGYILHAYCADGGDDARKNLSLTVNINKAVVY